MRYKHFDDIYFSIQIPDIDSCSARLTGACL